jgi:uncharacterized membrane protein (DUF4010 family)
MEPEIFQQLAIALGLGLLVGLQREWTDMHVAGIRTFALITVFGAVGGLLAESFGGWIVIAGLGGVVAMMVVENMARLRDGESHPGPTTELAALVMYAVGVLLVLHYTLVAVAVGGGVALLLHWKEPLHAFVHRIGERDIRAVFRLVLIALVVLPVLPDRTYGPYDVLNPFRIWLMVVLIVGISLGGYVAHRLLGAKAGAILGGMLGGVISSTATTVSYARRSRQSPGRGRLAALVIMIASTIVFGRVAIEIAVVGPSIFPDILPPLAMMMAYMALISVGLFLFTRDEGASIPDGSDPSDLKAAIVFGLLYALILFAVAAAKAHFGDRGLYIVAALSGLTDMDAITLSTAQLIKSDRLGLDTGWRMILIGALSNLFLKGMAVALLGDRGLLKRIAVVFGASLAGGVLLLLFWPKLG